MASRIASCLLRRSGPVSPLPPHLSDLMWAARVILQFWGKPILHYSTFWTMLNHFSGICLIFSPVFVTGCLTILRELTITVSKTITS
jgi:hypothetical protein